MRTNEVKYLDIISPKQDWGAKRSARTGEEYFHCPSLNISLWAIWFALPGHVAHFAECLRVRLVRV